MNIGFNYKSPAALASIRVSLSLSPFYQKLWNYHFWFNISKLHERRVQIYIHTHISFLVFSLLTDLYVLSRVWLCATPETEAHQVPLSMEFLGKNTRVGCYSLLQGIFPTQGSNLHLSHLLHWQENSLPLCYLGSPLLKYAFIYIAFSVCQNHDKLGSLNLDYKHLLRNS